MNDLDITLQKIIPDLKTVQISIPLTQVINLYLADPALVYKNYSYNESLSVIEKTPFWALCWPSGFAAAEYILNNPNLVKGLRVIDFGSGSGIVAVAAAMSGASEVIACDLDADALKAAQLNAELNKVHIKICEKPENNANYDLLIAADVLYNSGNMHMLNMFLEYAPLVLLAESRVKDINNRSYKKIYSTHAHTYPMDFSGEDESVSIYKGSL